MFVALVFLDSEKNMFVALVFLDSEIRLVCPKCCLLPKPKLACKVSKSSLSGKIPDRGAALFPVQFSFIIALTSVHIS